MYSSLEGRRAGLRALLHALHRYMLRAKIILVDFNLVVSTPTVKPPNLISRQIFRLYGNFVIVQQFCAYLLTT